MTDLTLQQDIMDELSLDPKVEAAHIGVAVDQGVVTLTGHVTDFAAKLAAEEAVRRVRGVRAVAEEIEIRVPNHKMIGDDEIATRAANILDWTTAVPKKQVRITVHKGWVCLEGEVDWQFQRTLAQDQVSKLSGLVGVVNNITIKNQPNTPDIRQRIEGALRRNAAIEASSLQISAQDDGKVILKGNVRSWDQRRAAENVAWSVPGVMKVESHLKIV